ncbi:MULTISPECIES: hypothetical protein [Campylobacter]|uniref:hypothetical protein n=1 Tax=Campylobacter TaxID=194 RepID=UPI000A34C259|nr:MULTISPECIES: hypothetical protein [unclassified Campylobacter]MCR8679512.1 hypothetical protein [Campylobacter sp. RM19072]MCR8695873.1 hypothetical protein [Campylobacter sp. RM19073]
MRVVIFAIFILILASCTSSSSVLTLKDYSVTSENIHKKVLINSITDTRPNKSIVATITDSKGSVEHSVILSQSLEDSFAKALNQALGKNGDGDEIVVDIEIVQFSANLSGYSGENLKGQSKVIIKIKNGDKVITKTISQPQSRYTPLPIPSAFEPFINDMLRDMVEASIKAILSS